MCINCDQEIPKGDPGNNGTDGLNGNDGLNGTNGISIGYVVTSIAPGLNCSCGGTMIEIGPDLNYDGIPESITNTIYVCNGCDGRDLFNPVGSIITWFGNVTDINNFDDTGLGVNDFKGWALCNGQNSTPDLRGRFIIAQGENQDVTSNTNGANYSVGDTGGVDAYRLRTNELAPHSHGPGSLSASGGNHTHTYVNYPNQADIGSGGTSASRNNVATNQTTGGSGSHTHTITGNTSNFPNQAEADPHENMPPYFCLAYIMRIS